ncbi:SDR family oxidoreductase [Allostreptomyces psammosilenae]|uniref:Nucleoside-diphosphate-sugar epimerase n=1 Tax=Allostreptomyces psammosilenae TaxID=1892865 RepID=A0A853A2Z1_9ACTN|nr:SDR family oxidoreductase [Allostreptomyces psammosilenae]NYI07840.1 nucleoside-diphosphate-sugar epimerase [Allostreptomyces psammosilenae]
MRVFVTGATGFVGSAVVRELIDAGHHVVGLARSDDAVASLTAAGAEPHRGSLDDLDSLRDAASASDGVIHLAYVHDFGNLAASAVTDLRAVEAIGDALAGSGKPFVVTSGTAAAATPGRPATEEDAADPDSPGAHRRPSEIATLALAERGVRSSVVRLPPSVHDRGDYGFVPRLIELAREKGVSAYVGEGANRWSAVHRLDAARLFRLAAESAPAGTRLHGVGDEGVPFREIAGVIGRHLGLPVVSVSGEEAAGHFGWLGALAAYDGPTSSALTRKWVGWHPERPGLLADLEEGHYFDE